MILMKTFSRLTGIIVAGLLAFSAGMLNASGPTVYNNYLQPVVTAIDYHTRVIYLFNYENDKLIIVDPQSINGWPGDIPLQHTAILPGGDTIYISSDNTEDHSSYIIALKVISIDWDAGTAALNLESVMVADSPNTPAELPFVEPVNDVQDVPNWLIGRGTQIHGNTFLPYSDFMYMTEFTSDRVRVIDVKTNQLASVDPISIPGYTEQTHGINFNSSGTIGLGTGYFFDNSVIDVYKPNRETGELHAVGQIMLGDEKGMQPLHTLSTGWTSVMRLQLQCSLIKLH